MDKKKGKMTMTANNGKKVGSALAKNGGSVSVRKISNGWLMNESWETKSKAKKGAFSNTDYHSEETYFEKNPFA